MPPLTVHAHYLVRCHPVCCFILAVVMGWGSSLSAQQITVIVGDTTPAPAKTEPAVLNHPFAVEFDRDGHMLVVEYVGGRVLRQSAGGEMLVIAGLGKPGFSGDGGPASSATFNQMHNLAVGPSGDIFLSDHENHVVRRIEKATGTITTYAGTGEQGFSGDGGPAAKAQFNQVMCVTLAPDRDRLLVTDLKNRRIRSIDLKTTEVTTIAGNGNKGVPRDGEYARAQPLVDPRAAAMDADGNLYILERGGNALRVMRPSGKIETIAGTGRSGRKDGPALQAELSGPKHLAIAPGGDVYIADDMNHLIRKYDPSAKTLVTVLGNGEFKLNRPHGVLVREGELYIADSWNHRVLKMSLPITD